MGDDWPKIHAEREACADLFESLTPEQWTVRSWCDAWNVRELAGHMIAATASSPAVFFSHMAKAGFSFNKMVDADAKAHSAGDPSALAAAMRAGALRRNHPPGPVTAMLGEAVIHGEDMRRPLGLSRDIPEASLIAVADFYKNSNLIVGAKRRIAGVRLKASDVSWTNGDGPEVIGTLSTLILAMTGRKQVAGDLSGDGAALLAGRL